MKNLILYPSIYNCWLLGPIHITCHFIHNVIHTCQLNVNIMPNANRHGKRFYGGGFPGINRRYQPRGENEVRYLHECRARRSARGSGPTRVLILTRVQSPRGWYCIYQIFKHVNRALN